MSNNVSIKGNKELERYLSKMADPNKTFDAEVKKTTRKAVKELKIKTLAKKGSKTATGNVNRAWQPIKRGSAHYEVENNVTTRDRKRLIVKILDQGRPEIKPKKAKRLYIPLSKSGVTKPLGARIPKSFIFGKDYVLAKKAKAVPGRKFIDKIIKESKDFMANIILSKVSRL